MELVYTRTTRGYSVEVGNTALIERVNKIITGRPTSISSLNKSIDHIAYPNPAADNLHVLINNCKHAYKLDI